MPVRILLVEDSDPDADLVAQAARELGYDMKVQRFVSAPQAQAGLVSLNPIPDGALLDLNLPGGSGLDVLHHIRQDERLRGLPVVVMTSSVSSRDREAAERLGVQGYLAKPSEYDEFVEMIGQAFRSMFIGDAGQPGVSSPGPVVASESDA